MMVMEVYLNNGAKIGDIIYQHGMAIITAAGDHQLQEV